MEKLLNNKITSSILKYLSSHIAYCDTGDKVFEYGNKPTTLKVPMNFENMKNAPSQATVGTFDGLRVSVQKQLNLNSIVSHFYWLGSQATGQPIYQYRIIFADEEKFVNLSTDADINVEGEVKWPLTKGVLGKLNFTLADQAKNGFAEVHYSGDDWTGHVSLGRSPGWVVGCSYVQTVTEALSLGGAARWDIAKDAFSQSFAGAYDSGENLIAAKYDTNLQILYLRRVNPGRVNVSTDLVLGEDNSTTMTLNSEFILKQSKVNLSVDSNLFLKSMIETTLAPGTSLQFSAEMLHAKDHYRFGYGITMGGN